MSVLAVVAPFANERVREWPLDRFRAAIDLLRRTHRVLVVGSPAQRLRASLLVRGFDAREVVNACGRTRWADVVAAVDEADVVVANNSGIAHLAAARGRWTLCIFSGSHPYQQWRPVGPRVVTVTRRTACSPCRLAGEPCPNGLACLVDLDAAFALGRLAAARQAASAAQAGSTVGDRTEAAPVVRG